MKGGKTFHLTDEARRRYEAGSKPPEPKKLDCESRGTCKRKPKEEPAAAYAAEKINAFPPEGGEEKENE